MRRAIQILAIAGLALVLPSYEIASAGGGNVDPGGARTISKATARDLCKGNWTKSPKQLCTWCGKPLLGTGTCHLIGCDRRACKYIVLPRGTARAARISLGQCIGNYDSCRLSCTYGVLTPPDGGGGLSDYEYKQCLNHCDANHFVCVDKAMDFSY
jgi:hypothetical protein